MRVSAPTPLAVRHGSKVGAETLSTEKKKSVSAPLTFEKLLFSFVICQNPAKILCKLSKYRYQLELNIGSILFSPPAAAVVRGKKVAQATDDGSHRPLGFLGNRENKIRP